MNYSGFFQSNFSKSDMSTLRLAFVEGLPPNCLRSTQSLLTCSDWRLRLSGYYLNLIWPRKTFSIKIFPSVSKVWTALESGEVDVYLMGHPLDENLITRVYATSMLYRSVDVMFTKAKPAVHSENPAYFWISCFTMETWMCIFAVLIFIFLTYLIVEKVTMGNIRRIGDVFRPVSGRRRANGRDEDYLTTKRCLEGCFLIFALLFTIYDSNVKAMVYTNSFNPPFVSVVDLANKIRSGEKRMILERRDTDRWRILNNLNETNYDTIKYLRNAVVEMNALTYITDVGELCKQLSINQQLVYFGSEKITDSSCPEYCLWKFELPEEIAKPVYYVISKKTIRRGKLNITRLNTFIHALHNYGDVISLRGHDRADCDDYFVAAEYIKIDSLIVIVYFFLILLSVAVTALIGEVISGRFRGIKQSVVNNNYLASLPILGHPNILVPVSRMGSPDGLEVQELCHQ